MEEKTITSPIKAIRAKCLDCCCGSAWAFRFGKNPYITKRELSDERKAEIVARLEAGRLAKKTP